MKQPVKWIYFIAGLFLGGVGLYFVGLFSLRDDTKKNLHFIATDDSPSSLKALRAKLTDRKPLKINHETLLMLPDRKEALTPEMVKKIMTKLALKQYKAKGVSFVVEADYNWIASLTPDVGHKVLKLLRTLPMEYWGENIRELQRIPEADLKVHLKRRLETDVYCHDRTGNCYAV